MWCRLPLPATYTGRLTHIPSCVCACLGMQARVSLWLLVDASHCTSVRWCSTKWPSPQPGSFTETLYIFYLRSGPWYHKCGGTIINKWTIITAAHCLWTKYSVSDIQNNLRILPGLHHIPPKLPDIETSFSEWNTTAHEIFQFYRINDYNKVEADHDLAIIILKAPITYNDNVKSIKLADEKTGFKGKYIFVFHCSFNAFYMQHCTALSAEILSSKLTRT